MPLPLAVLRPFPPELTGHLAARLGEGQNGVRKALAGIVPVVVAALTERSAGGGEANAVYALVRQAFLVTDGQLDSVTGLLGLLGSGNRPGGALATGHALITTLLGEVTTTLAAALGPTRASGRPRRRCCWVWRGW